MDNFLTEYNEEYCKKSTKRPSYLGNSAEFDEPISESFKNFLQLNSDTTAPVEPCEKASNYSQKYEEKYSKLAKIYYSKPLDNEIIMNKFMFNGKSIYQCDYCDLEKDNTYKEEIKKKNMFRLPNDWDIPLSSYRYFHRNPIVINPNVMEPKTKKKIINNLDPQHHIRKILKVSTGKTEYSGIIGDLGELIMNEELHGKTNLI